MNLLIDNRTDEPLTAELEDAIRRAAAEALRYEEFDEDCEISVSIVDNEEIREIKFLTAHSMLHLLGYDHMEPEEEAEMFRRQKEILLQAGFPRE